MVTPPLSTTHFSLLRISVVVTVNEMSVELWASSAPSALPACAAGEDSALLWPPGSPLSVAQVRG